MDQTEPIGKTSANFGQTVIQSHALWIDESR
jgi:hypothetical protein